MPGTTVAGVLHTHTAETFIRRHMILVVLMSECLDVRTLPAGADHFQSAHLFRFLHSIHADRIHQEADLPKHEQKNTQTKDPIIEKEQLGLQTRISVLASPSKRRPHKGVTETNTPTQGRHGLNQQSPPFFLHKYATRGPMSTHFTLTLGPLTEIHM